MIKVYDLSEIELVVTDSYTIYYLVEGSMSAYIRGQLFKVLEDDMVVVNPYELGLIKPSLEEKSVVIKIVIGQEAINDKKDPLISFFNYIRREHLSLSLKQNILNLGYAYLLEIDMDRLLEEMIKKIRQGSYFIRDKKTWDSKKLLIKNMYDRDGLSSLLRENVSDVAKSLNVSYTMVSVSFKEVTGSTISEYRQYDKIIKSALILIQTNYSLEKIANIVGYESTKSLYDVYDSYVKFYPLELRDGLQKRRKIQKEDLIYIFKQLNIYELDQYSDNRVVIKHMTEIEERLKLHGKNLNDIVYDLRTVADNLNHLQKRLGQGYRFKYIQVNMYINKEEIYLIDYKEKIELDQLVGLIKKLALDGTELAIYIENANNEMKERIFKGYTENTITIRSYIKQVLDNISPHMAGQITWLLAYDIGLYQEGQVVLLEDKMAYMEKIYSKKFGSQPTVKLQIRDGGKILGLMKVRDGL